MIHSIYKEKAFADELGDIIARARDEGLSVFVRPRGPHGSRSGQQAAETAYINPEAHVKCDKYGVPVRTFKPRETVVVWSATHGRQVYPVAYKFGRTTRLVTFRVLVA